MKNTRITRIETKLKVDPSKIIEHSAQIINQLKFNEYICCFLSLFHFLSAFFLFGHGAGARKLFYVADMFARFFRFSRSVQLFVALLSSFSLFFYVLY